MPVDRVLLDRGSACNVEAAPQRILVVGEFPDEQVLAVDRVLALGTDIDASRHDRAAGPVLDPLAGDRRKRVNRRAPVPESELVMARQLALGRALLLAI